MRKLTKGLLNQREKISKQLGPNANEITIINRYRNTWSKNVWNVTSELLFASICGESGFGITFDPYAIDHDYDFMVNDYPVQVKSSNKSYSSFSAAAHAKKKRKGDVDDNKIKYDLVINKVLHTIHDNTSSIDDALEQGAKIVFLNETTDESGSYLCQYCIETQNSFYIEKALRDSINLLKRTDCFIPLIFCATAFRLIYYIHALAFRVPIIIMDGHKKVNKDNEIKLLSSF